MLFTKRNLHPAACTVPVCHLFAATETLCVKMIIKSSKTIQSATFHPLKSIFFKELKHHFIWHNFHNSPLFLEVNILIICIMCFITFEDILWIFMGFHINFQEQSVKS